MDAVYISVSNIRPDWLVEELPSFQLEEAARYELARWELVDAGPAQVEEFVAGIKPKFRTEWQKFISAALPGDSLWAFRSPRETWNDLAGRAGFAIVRNGKPVAALMTMIS